MSAEKSSTPNLTFLTGANADYIARLYGDFVKNPQAVDETWRGFFAALNDNEAAVLRDISGASWTPRVTTQTPDLDGQAVAGFPLPATPGKKDKPGAAAPVGADAGRAALDSIGALQLIRAYRGRGHLIADLDPLHMAAKPSPAELDPATYGFGDKDYDRPIQLNGTLGLQAATLTQIMDVLKRSYCVKIGVEFMHLADSDERLWIQERVENRAYDFKPEQKRAILKDLTKAETFEHFLNTKYQGTKRFGLDGGESTIPAIEQVLSTSVKLGVREAIFGMAHRGRLNLLTNVLGKPFTAVFSEFQGNSPNPNDVQGSGDVKYHLGTSADREIEGADIHLSLVANPSHLEAVDPVVLGKVRAKQAKRNDEAREQVMGIMLHGDAAFAGQGMVAETLMLSELPGYKTGGTLHFVINNQIGFTTMPQYSRSGPYCTDIAKMLCPIFHVNGDDPEAVVQVATLAAEFRHQFKKDVVIDMFCYRRFGHNESDEPAFTQPLMYKQIKAQTTTRELYATRLAAENAVSAEDAGKMVEDFKHELETAFEATKSYKPNKADFLEGAWSGMKVAHGDERRGVTALSDDTFHDIGDVLTTIPGDFNLNGKIARQIEAKKAMFDGKEGFDWATGEALAFGSLIAEGYGLRLSGQDVGRGTFSQRHAIVYDQENQSKYIPLQHVGGETRARVEIVDSPLSEEAVLGYEYGYSLADPKTLTIWEAQFGDFFNGAQMLVDQFISSGETKWLRMSGLVMLLPHGFEGQGPEHSSGRVERFLQMCAEDNWQVCNITTPANYFHALRRQMVRDFRKPLVVMTPKSLLRHKLAVSPAADFQGQTTFHRLLWDTDRAQLAKPEDIRRVVLCSGKVYYDLLEERRKRQLANIVILRVEQLYPFPAKAIAEELAQYRNADIVWCQEEPRNMGAWTFVNERLEAVLMTIKHKAGRPHYIGRAEAASPATGLLKRHTEEQAALVNEALTL